MLVCFVLVGTVSAQAETIQATFVYGDFLLPVGSTTFTMPGTWDLTAGQVKITYKADLTHAPNIPYTNDWSQMAMVGLFGGTPTSGARMAGFLTDWSRSGMLFPPYPRPIPPP